MIKTSLPRRNVLKTGAFGFATLLLAPLLKAHDGHQIEVDNDLLRVESGPGQIVKNEFAHHHHWIEIPLEFLHSPPDDGISISTGWAQFRNPLANIGKHFHTVHIAPEQLLAIANGEVVTVEDTVKDHLFHIHLP